MRRVADDSSGGGDNNHNDGAKPTTSRPRLGLKPGAPKPEVAATAFSVRKAVARRAAAADAKAGGKSSSKPAKTKSKRRPDAETSGCNPTPQDAPRRPQNGHTAGHADAGRKPKPDRPHGDKSANSKPEHAVRARAPSGGKRPGGAKRSDRPLHTAKTKSQQNARTRGPAGFDARRAATELVRRVREDGQPIDEALAKVFGRLDDARRQSGSDEAEADGVAAIALHPRDRALAHNIALTTLRHHGEIATMLGTLMEKGMPGRSGRFRTIVETALAQLFFLETPAHAVIDLAVRQCHADRHGARYAGVANAVLRRADREKATLTIADRARAARLNAPDWLFESWVAAYGPAVAAQIAHANMQPAALDLSLNTTRLAQDSPTAWAERLGGQLTSTGTVRLTHRGAITELVGFSDGAWWVQDAAAALPARILGDVRGLRVADLCAAPGGKTAQLLAAGAHVVAVDQSERRLQRLRENLFRLGLSDGCETVTADVTRWTGQEANGEVIDPAFDAVLLDAPCSATGTIRRHPDIALLKTPSDVSALAELQATCLRQAATLVKPGGRLLYCTCSLQPEEGPAQIAQFLSETRGFALEPIDAAEIGGLADLVADDGALRTFPFQRADAASAQDGDEEPTPSDAAVMPSGLDGFYIARLRRLPN